MAVGVQSDPVLQEEIRRYGKFDTAGCYQCGSCTVACELVTNSATFPRKVIRYALLGLREPLLESLDPWVCHDCGDCSIACPRQVDPRTSMITLRRFLNAQYDWTGIASKLLQFRAWYLGSLISAALLALLLILGYHLWYLAMPVKNFATTPFGLDHMFPIITYYTLTVMLLPLLLLFSRVHRIWRLTMCGEGRPRIPLAIYLREAWIYIYESATHSMMRKCPERGRWLGHWCLALGTTMMLIIKAFALRWFQTDNIYPFYHPQRLFGYLAASLMLYGLGDIFIGRLRAKKEFYKETYFENLVFPVLLVSIVLTGLSAHILRYLGFELACHYLYALHVIVATPMLLIEMSFGNWAHMVYRPVALYFLAVRDKLEREAPAGEVVSDAA
jgi:quinone-modifying oxidoreductase, subunit QmoC